MSRFFCWNDTDHERQARRDAARGRRDSELYDRYTFDPCKEVYTQEYDRERRAIERREEEREQERQEEQRQERRAQQRAAEQAEYERQQYEMEQAQEQEFQQHLEAEETAHLNSLPVPDEGRPGD